MSLVHDSSNSSLNHFRWELASICKIDLLFSLEAYREVNEIFAVKTMEAVRRMNEERAATNGPTPIVWIHDYHLMLAANTLR